MHVIAAKAACLYEANQPEFKSYMEQTLKNVQVMCKGFKEAGLPVLFQVAVIITCYWWMYQAVLA